jgi:hypothetical protein
MSQFAPLAIVSWLFPGISGLAYGVLQQCTRPKGQQMTHTATYHPMREPFEHFVILQLSEIRERESRLRKALEGLSNVDATCRSQVLSTELWQLRQCADRLDQMIDTMTAPELVV